MDGYWNKSTETIESGAIENDGAKIFSVGYVQICGGKRLLCGLRTKFGQTHRDRQPYAGRVEKASYQTVPINISSIERQLDDYVDLYAYTIRNTVRRNIIEIMFKQFHFNSISMQAVIFHS